MHTHMHARIHTRARAVRNPSNHDPRFKNASQEHEPPIFSSSTHNKPTDCSQPNRQPLILSRNLIILSLFPTFASAHSLSSRRFALVLLPFHRPVRTPGTESSNVQTWQVRQEVTLPPGRHTFYWCHMEKVPAWETKHQYIGVM